MTSMILSKADRMGESRLSLTPARLLDLLLGEAASFSESSVADDAGSADEE